MIWCPLRLITHGAESELIGDKVVESVARRDLLCVCRTTWVCEVVYSAVGGSADLLLRDLQQFLFGFKVAR